MKNCAPFMSTLYCLAFFLMRKPLTPYARACLRHPNFPRKGKKRMSTKVRRVLSFYPRIILSALKV